MNLFLSTEILGDISYSYENGFSEEIPIYLDGKEQEPFVYLFEKSITELNIDAAEGMLNQLEELFLKGKAELAAEAADNETVKYFLEFHYDELPAETAKACGTVSIEEVTYLDLIDNMTLGGLSMSLNEYGFLVLTLEYTLVKDISDEQLVAAFDENGEIVNISCES